jgi:hypothetical protein
MAGHGWRRKPLIISFIAGIASAAVVTGIVLAITRSPAEPEEYKSLPAPCLLVSPAILARYVPDAVVSPHSGASSSTHRSAGCTWSSVMDGENRTLYVNVDAYTSGSGVTQARQRFSTSVTCTPKCTTTRHAVAGLADQTELVAVKGVGAAFEKISSLPAFIFARSGNADITVNYGINPLGPASAAPSYASLAAALIAVARNVLAIMANPAGAASSGSSSALYHGPEYADPRDPRDACAFVPAAALAKYLPDATATLLTPSTGAGSERRSAAIGTAKLTVRAPSCLGSSRRPRAA